jgi:Ni,Fe-hydrogenase I small subunit
MFVYLRQTLCQKKISFLSEILLSRLSDGNRIMPLLKELGCRDPFLKNNCYIFNIYLLLVTCLP